MTYALLTHCRACHALLEAIFLASPEDSRADRFTTGWLERGMALSSEWVDVPLVLTACKCENKP